MNNLEELEYVGFWPRLGAYILDALILFLPLSLLSSLLSYFVAVFESGFFSFIFSFVIPALIVLFFWKNYAATPGKMAIGAKIMDESTGEHPSMGQFIGRYFAEILSSLILMLGFIWIAFHPKKQGWHDTLAGTVVVRKKRDRSV